MLVIRLSRKGAKNKPKYRVTVADSRKPLNGRFIELIGYYDPLSKNKKPIIDKTRYESWLKRGAKPSVRVQSLFARSHLEKSNQVSSKKSNS